MNMHRSLLLFLIVGSFSALVARSLDMSPKEGTTLLGSLVFPRDLTFVPSVTIFYKGTDYTIHNQTQKKSARGYFELYDAENHKTLYIVVTGELQIPTSKNITSLQTAANSPYRVFKIQRVIDDHADFLQKDMEDLVTWDITEMNNKEVGWKIPDNSIILFMDPSFIDSLENVSWHFDQPIVRLPKIVFKQTIDADLFKKAADKVQLSLIDFKFMHKKPSAQVVPYQNRTVAMPHWAGRSRA